MIKKGGMKTPDSDNEHDGASNVLEKGRAVKHANAPSLALPFQLSMGAKDPQEAGYAEI